MWFHDLGAAFLRSAAALSSGAPSFSRAWEPLCSRPSLEDINNAILARNGRAVLSGLAGRSREAGTSLPMGMLVGICGVAHVVRALRGVRLARLGDAALGVKSGVSVCKTLLIL